MNRSFRAQESQMRTAFDRQKQQLRASMMAEKEDELTLFLEMRRREKEEDNLLLNNPEEFNPSGGSSSPIFDISIPTPGLIAGADDFLQSDGDKNDYDWLLTPPGTPLFPSLEMESQKAAMNQLGDSKALNSRMSNLAQEQGGRSNLTSRQQISSPGMSSSSSGTRRPSSSGAPGSRPSTPNGKSIITTNRLSRPSTPTSRPAVHSTTRPSASSSRPTSAAASKVHGPSASSRSTSTAGPKLTPSSAKSTVSTAKSTGPATRSTSSTAKPTPTRSTTPLSRSIARSSTPTSRPSISQPKPISRSATPTRRPTTPSSAPSSAKSTTSQVKPTPSVSRPTPTSAKNTAPSRGASPTVRSRPWKPSDMPGFSLETPPNLRTSLPERPLSATRGRPGAPSSRSSSIEPGPGPASRSRRQSCSPSRGRAPNGVMKHASGSSLPAVSRGYSKVSDNVSPVLIGTKMVERVISMRKLAPPRSDNNSSPHGNLSAKSSSPDSSGFGRTLSKKSLDMAIRHMDIQRTIPGIIRPLMTKIPASSMYSIRSSPNRGRPVSVSDSPLATSSNASSELSLNNNGLSRCE